MTIAAEEFGRLAGSASGEALIKAMKASHYLDIKITSQRKPMPVRAIRV